MCQEKILDTFFPLCYSITVAMSERCRYGVIVGFQMEEKIEQAYLYDFYGELLNEHQKNL